MFDCFIKIGFRLSFFFFFFLSEYHTGDVSAPFYMTSGARDISLLLSNKHFTTLFLCVRGWLGNLHELAYSVERNS